MKAFQADFLRQKHAVLVVSVLAVVAAVAGRAPATSFTPGDLVVSTYGDNGVLASGAPSAISLIEYSTAGSSPLLTDTLPTANGVDGGNNLGIVGQQGSNSEGNIQLSGDGRYLTVAGYSAVAAAAGIDASTSTSFPLGTPFNSSTVSLAQSSDTNVPRVAALVDGNGNVNSSTELNDLYSTNNPRSVYSANGSTFYISGQGDGNNNDQGIFYGQTGLNTVSSPGASPAGIYNSKQTRFVTAFNGNLSASIDTSSGSSTGIWEFSGMPTSASTPTQITAANNGESGSAEVFYSPEGFFFANSDTLYVADTGDPKAGSPGDGGIQKWTFTGSHWALQYTLTPTALFNGYETGFAAITGEIIGTGPTATVDLFAVSYTSGDDEPDGLYSIADTLNATSAPGETFTKLESAVGNGGRDFKGVSFAPTPPTPGDANGDGKVDINDLTIVLANYDQTGKTWSQGDFIGDGKVDINDLTIVLAHYNQTTAVAAGAEAAVPEPCGLTVLATGLAGLLACVWRKRR